MGSTQASSPKLTETSQPCQHSAGRVGRLDEPHSRGNEHKDARARAAAAVWQSHVPRPRKLGRLAYPCTPAGRVEAARDLRYAIVRLATSRARPYLLMLVAARVWLVEPDDSSGAVLARL